MESKALSVSCNYELICWAAVWLNYSKQYLEEQDRLEVLEASGGEEGAVGGDVGGARREGRISPPGLDLVPRGGAQSPRGLDLVPGNEARALDLDVLPGPGGPLVSGNDAQSPGELDAQSPVVPHTYTTPWHQFLCTQLAGATHHKRNGETGETAMDVDSDVDEG